MTDADLVANTLALVGLAMFLIGVLQAVLAYLLFGDQEEAPALFLVGLTTLVYGVIVVVIGGCIGIGGAL